MGKEVVAEGVETSAQWQVLSSQGCHLIQGYFTGRPMAAESLLEWVQTKQFCPQLDTLKAEHAIKHQSISSRLHCAVANSHRFAGLTWWHMSFSLVNDSRAKEMAAAERDLSNLARVKPGACQPHLSQCRPGDQVHPGALP